MILGLFDGCKKLETFFYYSFNDEVAMDFVIGGESEDKYFSMMNFTKSEVIYE